MGIIMRKILEYDGLEELVRQIKQYVRKQDDILLFENRLSFPSIGKVSKIYLDLSTDLIYRWDDENINYFQIGFRPESIKIINGGNAGSL